MSDEQAAVSANADVEVDYKSLYEKAQKDVETLAAKKEELLKETKAAKKEREDTIAATQKAEKEKSQKDGEFEKLWQSSEQRANELESVLNNERNSYKQEKIQGHAMKLAIDLADGDALSAKLLATFIGQSISKMADEKGTLDDSVLSAVRKEFQNNADYAPLLAGSKASGGGALGNTKTTAQVVDTKLSPVDRMNASRQGK